MNDFKNETKPAESIHLSINKFFLIYKFEDYNLDVLIRVKGKLAYDWEPFSMKMLPFLLKLDWLRKLVG